jgi:hypothetical protein
MRHINENSKIGMNGGKNKLNMAVSVSVKFLFVLNYRLSI